VEQQTVEAAPATDAKPAKKDEATTQQASEQQSKTAQQISSLPPAQQYCVSIADAAADARLAWQAKTLAEMQQEVEKRVARLEEKIAEYRQWVARRDEFSKRAQDNLLNIFSRMRSDAAALQLAVMDEVTAAALLNKLDARVSSAILGEMEPNHAARLAAMIAGAAKVAPDRSAKTSTDGSGS
jgi:flagellar motility protein MotE (MotC chaperone)